MASHLFIIVFNVPASLGMWPVISLLLYLMFPLRWAVASHLFIIVFNDASPLLARFASLAMWPVISLLLYLMFPLRFAGDVASHLFIIVFNVPASPLLARFASLAMWPVISLLLYLMFPLRWRCGQSSLYYCRLMATRFAGHVASHLFIIVFNVPASLAMWPVISLLLCLMFPLRWACGQLSLYYCI